ncbi:uncharacterized protein L199_006260 [Kwoniella botswanensis]|uniref:uncharacterized protein n=1 Tax=Kwoniella botswanensis TaxID=1268659 RepID=UPI00315CC6F9
MASPSFEPTETLTLPSQITYKPYNDTSPDRPTIYCSVYPDNTHRAMLTPVTLYSSFVHPTTHPLAYSECAAVLQSISRELSITYGNQSNIRPFVNMSSK